MSFSLARAELVGRVGHDPTMRYTPAGQAITTFSLATDRPSRDGQPAETDWHRVVCFEKVAELANRYCTKGRLVYVAGRLQYRTYEGRDGQTRRAVEVVAGQLGLLDRPPSADVSEAPPAAEEAPDA
jgi:single-strand DNA-binding protein